MQVDFTDLSNVLDKLTKDITYDITERNEKYMIDYLKKILEYWKKVPELRFSQFIYNVANYYLSDKKLLIAMKKYKK